MPSERPGLRGSGRRVSGEAMQQPEQQLPVPWAHLSKLESNANTRNLPPHYSNGPQNLPPHVDSQMAHGFELKGLRTADEDTAFTEIHQIPNETDARPEEAGGYSVPWIEPLCPYPAHALLAGCRQFGPSQPALVVMEARQLK